MWLFHRMRKKSALLAAAKKAVEETATSVRDSAKENAPVDTGALRASIHVSTPERSDYGLAVALAMSLGGAKRFGQQHDSEVWGPRIAPEEKVTGGTVFAIAKVSSPLNYAQFVEHGHFNVRANRYIAGRKFLQRAEDENKLLLERVLAQEVKNIQ